MTRPLSKEIDYIDPLQAFALFANDLCAVFMDSADDAGGRGRYAYIAIDPVRKLTASTDELDDIEPFAHLREFLQYANLETDPDLPPFQTGVAGILGYELGRHLERLPTPVGDPFFPDISIGLYDTIVAFDTFASRAWVIASDLAGARAEDRPSAIRRMEVLAEKIALAKPLPGLDPIINARWVWTMDQTDYEATVAKAIDYIYAGDIFQANITTSAWTQMPSELDAFALYRRIRWLSPAPFAAYVSAGPDHKLLSASPERFLSLDASGQISTRPIKGTRPRGDVPELDAAYAQELTESAKDRAENLMIVDLLRNDISRVSLIGSVEVPNLHKLETFAHVHHLVSEVRSRLRPGFDAVDLLRASFPGGSITGAPKIRAMEIIHELENGRRGPYCGSVFWAGFNGAMDSSIIIRSLVLSEGRVGAHAGGGIVADSDPTSEYEEMRTKLDPLLASLNKDINP